MRCGHPGCFHKLYIGGPASAAWRSAMVEPSFSLGSISHLCFEEGCFCEITKAMGTVHWQKAFFFRCREINSIQRERSHGPFPALAEIAISSKQTGLWQMFTFALDTVCVLDDVRVREHDESFLNHLVYDWQERFQLLFGIYDCNHDGSVV